MDVNNANNANNANNSITTDDQKETNPAAQPVPITPPVHAPAPSAPTPTTTTPTPATPPASPAGTPISNASMPPSSPTDTNVPISTTPSSTSSASKDADFPFKAIEPDQPPKTDEKIGMNLNDEVVKEDAKTDSIDIKTQTVQNVGSGKDFQPMATPINASNSTSHAKSIITILTVAIAFMGLGLAGGYYGFKYSPKIAKLFSATADTTIPSGTDSNIIYPPKSSTLADVTTWPSYTNSLYKYTLKYPNNWYSQGITNPSAKTLSFTSFNPADSQVSGSEVNIDTQGLNGKTLKDWITDNNTVAGTSNTTVEPLTIGTQSGFQQSITGASPSVVTYVPSGDSVVIITFTAPTAEYSVGQDIYNKIITALTLS